MKGVVAMEPPPVYEDPRTRFKHQSLMQDYEELKEETEAMKRKLILMKHKKLTLSAEVRFLKRRYKYLIENQSMKPKPKQDFTQLRSYENRSANSTKAKIYNKKGAAFRYPAAALDSNQKERNGMEATLKKSTPTLDLNEKVRNFSGKEASLQNSKPSFDLNQISIEEEELQANCEQPWRREDPMKSLLRGGNDEQHNDMKLLGCRNIGNGSNRNGKRKITWQDQVALRV
ncbi:hypothetical protein FNV43_RR03376 [Rhamnella rubrinervis]|uniref:Uncharacterized protein n=1 Tax=Rhamnella rubrinervis TaxID=2594499 RepID=A0A8K0HJ13_9ROSA|nr:hypothetical protein FNV43_RR03376 [Rhamnella rubrinervis]